MSPNTCYLSLRAVHAGRGGNLSMVAVRAVGVAVLQFFVRRRPYRGDRAREIERLPGERMIAVNYHLFIGDVGDRIDQRLRGSAARPFELHADVHFAGKLSEWF